jgi:hypothetical protein
MVKHCRVLFSMFLMVGLTFTAGSCGSGKAFKPRVKKKPRISHYEIHQPDSTHPNDDVLIWKDSKRDERAFPMKPGTKVEVLETLDDEKQGKIMYKIKTKDDRTGWVPKSHCKAVYK